MTDPTNAATRPATKPVNPRFSSGPCAKHPGWTISALDDAPLGRSHRASVGKAKLKAAIDRTRILLGVPDDYRIGIVPASDTGAYEMAMWTMLGARPVTMLAWESFGEGWVTDAVKQLKLDADIRAAEYGNLPSLEIDPNPRHLFHLERDDLRRAGSERRLDRRRPRGPDALRRDLRGLRDGFALGQARCNYLLLAEGARRRGCAWRPDPVAPCGRTARELYSAPGRCRRCSDLPRVAN